MLKSNGLRLLIPVLLLIGFIACSSDDTAPAAVTSPTAATILDQAAVDPGNDEIETADLTVAPPGASQTGANVTVVEGLTIEPGTDAAELVSLWERQVGAVQRGDWEAYRQDCHPRIQDRTTAEQMKAGWEATFGGVGEGFNLMITDVRVYGGETANVTMDASDGPRGRFYYGITRLHEKSNGRWYNASQPCSRP